MYYKPLARIDNKLSTVCYNVFSNSDSAFLWPSHFVHPFQRDGGRERETERETDRDRQTDRDRETDRHRQIETETDRDTETEKQRQTNRETKEQRQKQRQTDGQRERQRQTDGDRQRDGDRDRQRDRQTEYGHFMQEGHSRIWSGLSTINLIIQCTHSIQVVDVGIWQISKAQAKYRETHRETETDRQR